MEYVSTKSLEPGADARRAPGVDFEQVVMGGMPADGGLYIPRPGSLPIYDPEQIQRLRRNCSYAEFAAHLMSPFVGDSIRIGELIAICEMAWEDDKIFERGRHADRTEPYQTRSLLHKDRRGLAADAIVLELFHGPTMAFKDIGLQFLARLFDFYLEKRDANGTVMAATTGDTGAAAVHALARSRRVKTRLLFDRARVSVVQRLHMTTTPPPTVLAIEAHTLSDYLRGHAGNASLGDTPFETCQQYLKYWLRQPPEPGEVRLTVNSINYARILAQMVYYWHSVMAIRSYSRDNQTIRIVVPSGNFGNAYAAWLAVQTGLPHCTIDIACNQVSRLPRLMGIDWGDSDARVRQALKDASMPAGDVPDDTTCASAMDIRQPSNFERLATDLLVHDSHKRAALVRNTFKTRAMYDSRTTNAIEEAYSKYYYLMDPHTVVGHNLYGDTNKKNTPEDDPALPIPLYVATAHPCKFRDLMFKLVGEQISSLEKEVPLPDRVNALFGRQEWIAEELPSDMQESAKAYCASL